MRVTTLVGNPKAGSRTRELALAFSAVLAPHAVHHVIDLSDPVPPDPASLRDSDLLVVVSPTYKGSYTGLLKAYLDALDPRGLAGIVAVPIMVADAEEHGLVATYTLAPLLAELGAFVIPAGLTLAPQRGVDAVRIVDAAVIRTIEAIERVQGVTLSST